MSDFEKIRVKYIGDSNPLALIKGKEYDAIIGQKGIYCIIDETGEEYGYPSDMFEIINV